MLISMASLDCCRGARDKKVRSDSKCYQKIFDIPNRKIWHPMKNQYKPKFERKLKKAAYLSEIAPQT